MKKYLFSAVMFLMSAISMAQSPALKIVDIANGEQINDSTVWIYGGPTTTQLVAAFNVVNQSGGTLNVKAERKLISAVGGTTNSFCWNGNCYPPSVGISPTSDAMANHDTVLFDGDYNPAGNVGITTIKYTYFDVSVGDSAWVIVNFDITPTGVAELSSSPLYISAPFPNPGHNSVSFSYHSNTNARLMVYNSLGQLIEEMPLNPNQEKVALNVEGIASGIYICKMESAGSDPVFQKLIVSH